MSRTERTRNQPAPGPGAEPALPDLDLASDLVPVEVAVLDRDGVIVSVNQAWVDFCVANGGDPARAGVGVSYLEVCDAAAPDPAAIQVGAAIRRALDGDLLAAIRVEIPCDAPDAERRFEVQIASRFADDGSCAGGIVALSRSGALPLIGSPPVLHQVEALPLLEAAPDGLVVVGAGGRVTYVNRALEALSGYGRTELIGRPVEVLVPEALRARHHGLHREYALSPRARMMGQGAPLQVRRRDGSLVPVEISLAPTVVDGQQVVLAGVRDLSPRRELEQRLQLVADLLDTISDRVVVLDVATEQRVYVNQAVLDATGYTREQLNDVPIGAPADGADRERISAAVAAVLDGTAAEVSLDSQVRYRDGASTPVELRITHRPDPAGNGPGHVIFVGRDLSDRLAAQERVRLSQESFRAAFEHAPIAMTVTRMGQDGSRLIVRANPALGVLLGVPAEELVGRDFAEFTYPEDEDADRQAAAALASGSLQDYVRHKRYRRADGTDVWVEFRAAPVEFPDLPGTTMLAHFVDVTDQHHAEQDRARQAAVTQAIAEATTAVLAGDPLAAVYQLIAERMVTIFGAQDAIVGFVDPTTGAPSPVAAAGPVATALQRGDLPVSPAFGRHLMTRPTLASAQPPEDVHPRVKSQLGPWAAARFDSHTAGAWTLAIARKPGAAAFTATEVEQLDQMADQLALTIELGHTRAATERLTLLEERQRIARDLHDHVIQDLFALGMQLSAQSLRRGETADSPDSNADADMIDQLDHAIRRLRGAVFELTEPTTSQTPTDTVRTVLATAARVLGHQPTLTLTGPVDELPSPVVEDLVAVLREALSNIARHAQASRTTITITCQEPVTGRASSTGRGGTVTLTVEDDGIGIGSGPPAGNGLANIRARAQQLGGRASITARQPTGTRVRWTAPTSPLHSPTRGPETGHVQGVHEQHPTGEPDDPATR